MMRLLVVDHDRDLVEMLMGWLKTLGYEMHRAYSGEQARRVWLEQEPDLVILDTTLKDVDALAMCRDLRAKHDALVLVVTDGKDVQDEVRCLESGADDYLRKPFFPAQLLARIRALSRRGRSTLRQRPSSIITVGPISVDSLHNEVTIYGRTARMTPTESKLLHLLAVNANDVCTSQQIVAHIWGFGDTGDACLIKAHIRHLRQKIEPNPAKPYYILTVPGIGYTLIRRPVDEQLSEGAATTVSQQGEAALRLVSG
jgi:DNA-binding response OmpR family regulator